MKKKYRKENYTDLFTVYMHVFPNDKVYIGITSQNPPENRWLGGCGYKNQIRVWRAIQKYGWDNIDHIIIARDVNIKSATNLETDLIKLYNSTDKEHGYNANLGGWAMGEDAKHKLSVLHKGKKLSFETKKKISEGLKGRKPSEKAIELIREYNRTRDYSKMVQLNEAPVLQFSIENGELIREYKSINRAANEYGVDARNIKCCIDEYVVQYIGYLWVDKKKATSEYIAKRLYFAQNPPRAYPVMLYDTVNCTKEYFKSQKELCANKKFNNSAISGAIRFDRLFNKQYRIFRISIPEYVEATGEHFYLN